MTQKRKEMSENQKGNDTKERAKIRYLIKTLEIIN